MGREGWLGLCSERIGDSTAAMAQAETVFGQAHTRVNDVAIARLPAPRAKAVKAVRMEMRALGSSLVRLSYAFSGGGTIWVPVEAGVPADVESVIARLVEKPGASVPKATASAWSRAEATIARLGRKVKSERKSLEEMGVGDQNSYRLAKSAHAESRSRATKLKAAAHALPGDGSRLVAEWAQRRAQTVAESSDL